MSSDAAASSDVGFDAGDRRSAGSGSGTHAVLNNSAMRGGRCGGTVSATSTQRATERGEERRVDNGGCTCETAESTEVVGARRQGVRSWSNCSRKQDEVLR